MEKVKGKEQKEKNEERPGRRWWGLNCDGRIPADLRVDSLSIVPPTPPTTMVWDLRVKSYPWLTCLQTSPQQGDLGLSGPLLGQGTDIWAQTRNRRIPADLRTDLPATLPLTP
ncbi:hypothetical protein PoB_001685000 [Plakobranchus ocellatus]|uniref:Uncharacterized protein n=1 Tax=Plakobranchus ocellatus TaxID=259542 RepID=A0AAV3Z5B3_9GAST|nr:hypothetical protein PoB_001685000 [Plakobranchus ocellatus]